MPPITGATQKSHSCSTAQPPAKNAVAVLRAGFTEVFVTGMLTRWTSVRHSPIARGAMIGLDRRSVAPWMTNRNIAVITTSMMKQLTSE